MSTAIMFILCVFIIWASQPLGRLVKHRNKIKKKTGA